MDHNGKSVPVETQQTSKIRQHIAAIIISLAAISSGTVIGWTSPVIPTLQSTDTPLHGAQPITFEEASWLGGLLGLGALASTPIFSYLAMKYSRKQMTNLATLTFIIGWLLIVFANSTEVLYVGRFILGFAAGGVTITVPLFVSEISEDSVRGTLGSYLVLFINAGILFVYVIGSYLPYDVVGYICLAIPAVNIVALYWLPESPVHLMRQDKIIDARRALKWYRNGNMCLVDEEINKFTASLKAQDSQHFKSENMSLSEMFRSKGTVRGLIIGVGLCANMQLCGVIAVVTYTVSIFKDAGSDLSPNAATILVGGLQLLGSYAATILVDRTGRKVLLVASNICMATCLSLLGTYFYVKHLDIDMNGWGWLPVTSVAIFIAALAMGVAPVTFIVISEVFTPRARGTATTISISVLWALLFIVGKFFANLCNLVGLYGCYWIFAVVCVVGALFCRFYIPETKNRSLESILAELNGESESSHFSVSNKVYSSPTCIIGEKV